MHVDQLLDLPHAAAREQLAELAPTLDEARRASLARALKAAADQFLRADIQRSQQTAELLYHLADLTGDPASRALGLLAEANARCIGLGQYQAATGLYEAAADLYAAAGRPVDQATAQIGKIYALTHLSRYDEGLQTGAWAAEILAAHEDWFALARLTGNLAIIHVRLGHDDEALRLFERAQTLYARAGLAEGPGWLRAEFNRAIILRNLGQFDASIDASQRAHDILIRLGQPVEAARAHQNLAITYFVTGRFNEALALLDDVRDAFLADGRRRDAILAELFIADCLLQLGRYADVLAKCRTIRQQFAELGTRFELAQAIVNEGVAYAGLGQYDAARASLAEARDAFAADGNVTWVATTDLETAAVLWRQGQYEEGLAVAQRSAAVLGEHNLPVARAQALLVAARAAIALGQTSLARRLAGEALAFAEERAIPSLAYQGHYLEGQLAAREGELEAAVAAYDRAIAQLEQLRGRLMIEFRADFLQDRQAVYGEMVDLCLELARPEQGLAYAERAKSRALLDLLAFRLELGIEARDAADQPLVEELQRLRAERDRLYRRWESGEGLAERGASSAHDDPRQQQVQQEVLVIERRITELWHRLLIRNADYARDAALWQVRAEPVQPELDDGTLLLEYFATGEELIAFLVTGRTITARRLPGGLARAAHLLRLLRLNLGTLPQSHPAQRAGLAQHARALLAGLYEALIAPLADQLADFPRLVIVPHGLLHYLPFHAFHDGRGHLIEQHEISYLPGASFWHYYRRNRRANGDGGLLAVGHSYDGRLPYTVDEAQTIAALWPGQTLLEEEATPARLRDAAAGPQILHLATHGDFRPDNPLFSGLALTGGWLTTLDIFNLRCPASLVTLSACQTGRSVVGGGDELLGLMRAFLSAGASSLVLTLWPVEDRATARLMASFYQQLAAGAGKGAALRQAQRQFLAADSEHAHPYFWAPFYLVGDPGPL